MTGKIENLMSQDLRSTAYATKKKPNRNATCPCGSNQKFKKCCIQGWEFFALCFLILDQGNKVRGRDGSTLFERKDRPKLIAAARKIGMIRE